MALHQLLEAVLDLVAVSALTEPQRLQRFLLQGLESPHRLGLVAPETPLEESVRIDERAAEGALFLGTLGITVGSSAPSRSVADDGIFLEGIDLRRAPTLEVVVGGVKLPHVLEAEQTILALLPPPHGRLVEAWSPATLPLAHGPCRRCRRLACRLGSQRVEVFRVKLHGGGSMGA